MRTTAQCFQKVFMKQSLQTEALSGKTLWFCRYGDSGLCCIKVGVANKVFVQYFLLRCIDFCIKCNFTCLTRIKYFEATFLPRLESPVWVGREVGGGELWSGLVECGS